MPRQVPWATDADIDRVYAFRHKFELNALMR